MSYATRRNKRWKLTKGRLKAMRANARKARAARRNPSKLHAASKKRIRAKAKAAHRRSYRVLGKGLFNGHARTASRRAFRLAHASGANKVERGPGALSRTIRQYGIEQRKARSNPAKKSKSKVTPSTAAARLARWRWHRNPEPTTTFTKTSQGRIRASVKAGPHGFTSSSSFKTIGQAKAYAKKVVAFVKKDWA